MSAIVTDPVPSWAGPAVVSCIPCSSSKSRGGDPTQSGAPCAAESRRCYGNRALLLDTRQEQRLIDSSLEDRHAHFHALLDHVAPFHSGFASELRGREMDCHRYESSW